MKKLLALVLALVMSMSLVTISNAAYADAADIDYKEAVDVMSAIGVLQGSDGKFNPDGILTRAEACTIITKMLGMADYVGTTNFADAKGHWGESAIAFCAGEAVVLCLCALADGSAYLSSLLLYAGGALTLLGRLREQGKGSWGLPVLTNSMLRYNYAVMES